MTKKIRVDGSGGGPDDSDIRKKAAALQTNLKKKKKSGGPRCGGLGGITKWNPPQPAMTSSTVAWFKFLSSFGSLMLVSRSVVSILSVKRQL